MIRLLILYGQPKDPAGFLKYYNEVHIPIAKKMKGLKGWTIGKVIGTPGDQPTPYFYVADLVAQAGMTPIGPDRYPALTEPEMEALDPDRILLPSEPYRFTRRHLQELGKRFPAARVKMVDGRAFTWYLSRTEQALDQLATLLEEAP